jgi:hypothetical protein
LPEDYQKSFRFSPKESPMSFTAAENPRAGEYIAGKLYR